jgi:hypothetical protein
MIITYCPERSSVQHGVYRLAALGIICMIAKDGGLAIPDDVIRFAQRMDVQGLAERYLIRVRHAANVHWNGRMRDPRTRMSYIHLLIYAFRHTDPLWRAQIKSRCRWDVAYALVQDKIAGSLRRDLEFLRYTWTLVPGNSNGIVLGLLHLIPIELVPRFNPNASSKMVRDLLIP